MNNEFLRPRENRSKWFNNFGVTRRKVYIVRSDKIKYSHKNNIVNRFTKWVNRFRQQKYKPKIHEEWYDWVQVWIDSCEPRMKNDVIQPIVELIQCKSEESYDAIQTVMNRFKLWWIDSHMIRLKKVVNRSIWSQRLQMIRFKVCWIDSTSKKMKYDNFQVIE